MECYIKPVLLGSVAVPASNLILVNTTSLHQVTVGLKKTGSPQGYQVLKTVFTGLFFRVTSINDIASAQNGRRQRCLVWALKYFKYFAITLSIAVHDMRLLF